MQKRRLLESSRPRFVKDAIELWSYLQLSIFFTPPSNRSKKLRKSTLRRKFRPPSAASKANTVLDTTPALSPGKTKAGDNTEGVEKVQVRDQVLYHDDTLARA